MDLAKCVPALSPRFLVLLVSYKPCQRSVLLLYQRTPIRLWSASRSHLPLFLLLFSDGPPLWWSSVFEVSITHSVTYSIGRGSPAAHEHVVSQTGTVRVRKNGSPHVRLCVITHVKRLLLAVWIIICARRDIFFWFSCRLPSFFLLQSICKTMCGFVCYFSVCEWVVTPIKGFESVKGWTRQKAIVMRMRVVPFSLWTKHGFSVDRSCRQCSLYNPRAPILVEAEPRESWLFFNASTWQT